MPRNQCSSEQDLYVMRVVPMIGLLVHLLTGGQSISLISEEDLVRYH